MSNIAKEQYSLYLIDYFVSLSQTPAMTIVANVIIKTTAAGSGVLDIGKPSATVYPVKSIILLAHDDSSTPSSCNTDSL